MILVIIQNLRNGFTTMYGNLPSTTIDTNIQFNKLSDLFNYFLTAINIGFFMPNPLNAIFNNDFFYLISSLEMFFMYLIYIFFIFETFILYIFSFLR